MALADNLVAYWSLEANSNDSVGSNNGTDTSITYSSGNGKVGNGAGFNGTTSKILIANLMSGQQPDFTVAAWVKSSQTGAFMVILQQRDAGSVDGQFIFGLNANQLYILTYSTTGGGSYGYQDELSDGSSYADGNWHHVAFVSNGLNGTFYKDGASDGTATALKNATYNASISGSIGWERRDAGSGFNGSLDEVSLWTRSLSGAEITQLYNGGAGLAYPLVLGPVNVKTWNGVTQSTGVKTYNGIATASVKSVNGIT